MERIVARAVDDSGQESSSPSSSDPTYGICGEPDVRRYIIDILWRGEPSHMLSSDETSKALSIRDVAGLQTPVSSSNVFTFVHLLEGISESLPGYLLSIRIVSALRVILVLTLSGILIAGLTVTHGDPIAVAVASVGCGTYVLLEFFAYRESKHDVLRVVDELAQQARQDIDDQAAYYSSNQDLSGRAEINEQKNAFELALIQIQKVRLHF
jgi:hypothetical protein